MKPACPQCLGTKFDRRRGMARKEGRVAASFLAYNKPLLLATYVVASIVITSIFTAPIARGMGGGTPELIAWGVGEGIAVVVGVVIWHRKARDLESATYYRCRRCGWSHIMRKFDVWPTQMEF
jgi:hypothetical protein